MPRSFTLRLRRIWVAWMRHLHGEISAACSVGCVKRFIRRASCFRPATLIEHITGSKPDHRPLIDGLRRKYGELYGI